MDVFISADMEGVSGVTAAADVVRGTDSYEYGQGRMHDDVNAAIAGAFDGGATRVLVNDSHSSMRNLEADRLDDRAALIRGSTKPRSMMQGLEPTHDVACFVGYHAMAGTPEAVLNHTFYGHELIELAVNGTPVGELGWNARLAGALGVPVGLVTGDQATASEADTTVPTARTVTVKTAADRFSARCRPMAETAAAIRDAAETAVIDAADGSLETLAPPPDSVTISAKWVTTNYALAAAGAPGVDRLDGRTTAVTAEDYQTAFDDSMGMLRAASGGANEYFG